MQVRKFHWFFCPPDHYDWQSRWGARGTPRTTSSTKVRAPAHHPPSVGNSWSTLVHLFWLHFTWLYPSYRHCKHLLLKFPLNFAFRLNIMTLSSAICGRNCWLISIHHIPLKFGQKFSYTLSKRWIQNCGEFHLIFPKCRQNWRNEICFILRKLVKITTGWCD